MAAVILAPTHRPADRPRAVRPDLRVIPGGRDRRSSAHRPLPAAVYWRRRVLAALLLVTVVALLSLATLGVRAIADTPTVPGVAASAGPAAAVTGESYVVRSGDTLWTIARRLQPTGDVRPLVDRLADRAGGAGIEPGQRIDLDGLVG